MIEFNLSAFERAATAMRAAQDQVPFALSVALNNAVKTARFHLIDTTWPQHVEVKNRNFLRNALRMEFSTKQRLEVAIANTGEAGNRGHLALHAKGGVKQARGNLAIPTARVKVRRTGRGVPANLRPGNLPRAVRKGNLIFQPEGRGKNAKLRLMYALRPSARIKADVPFHRDFYDVMRRELAATFPKAMARAMSTRR